MSYLNNNIKSAAVWAVLALAACSGGDGSDAAGLPGPGSGGDPDPEYVVTFGAEASSGNVAGVDVRTADTRAVYDGVAYKWSEADRAGLYMVAAGEDGPVFDNVRMTSTNTAPAQVADFEGEVSGEDLRRVDPEADYDYYSYFPYTDAATGSFPIVPFEIPATMDMMPDVFPAEYGFMVADPETTAGGEKPVSWLEGDRQRFGEYVGFGYRHVFAYLEVYTALNLSSQPINKIVVTCTDGSPISGTANVDVRTGEITGFTGGSGSLTVNIGGGGLDIRSATDYGRIWIPVDPALAGKEFRFEFHSVYGNVSSQTVTGGGLQAGMKHRAGLITGWSCNFVDLNPRPDSWSGDNITHRGHSFWRSNVNLGPNRKGPFNIAYSEDFNPFEGAVIYFDDKDGQIETPAIQLTNSLGLTSVNVRVTFTASGNAATGEKHIRHGFTKSGIGSDLTGQSNLDLNSARAYSFTGTLSSATPNIKFQGFTWGYYWIYMQSITVEYVP